MGQQAVAVSQQDWMEERAALEVLADIRLPGQAVITNQTSAVLWPYMSDDALDYNYKTSNMGGAVSFALGVALAQPERKVLVVSGEGALLMNLGCLVTVTASGASNLTVLVLDNRMYEGTGRQQTPSALADTDFAGFARAAGFANVTSHHQLDEWQRTGRQKLAAKGPNFICLQVTPCEQKPAVRKSRPLPERTLLFSQALRS